LDTALTELCDKAPETKGYPEPITFKEIVVIGCFLSGNILHGAGGAVFYPIGFSILDALFADSQLTIGIWTASFAIGPSAKHFFSLSIRTSFLEP